MSNLVSLFYMMIKRLWHSLGLSVSALAGMVCVLTITISVPIFSNAVSRELLRRELAEQAASTRRALFSLHLYYHDTEPPHILDVDTSGRLAEYIATRLEDLAGFNVQQVVTQIESPGLPMRAVQEGIYDDADRSLNSLRFMAVQGLPEHALVVEGEWPAPETSDAGPVRIAVHEAMADGMGLNVGEQYTLGEATTVEIAAVWRAIDPHEEFWFNLPRFLFGEAAWVSPETYRTRVEPRLANPVFSTSWYVIVEEDSLRLEHAPTYAHTIQRLDNEMRIQLIDSRLDYSPYQLLVAFQERAESLTTMLYAVGAPMLVLALLFIGLTSSIAVQQRTPEVATMRSRGTSRIQVVTMNLGESAVLLMVALPLSFAAAWYAATVMSQTRSFLEFTPRPALSLSYDGLNVLLLIAACAFIVLARLLPAWRDSRRSVVQRKQQSSRESAKPLWQRLYLDLFLLLIALYAYVVLRGWAVQTKLVPQLELSGQPYRDPLLFVAPALFAIATSIALMRVVPLIARMLAGLGARLPGAWQYLSLQQIARRPQDHTSALMLIMISLSLAIFSASVARTLDQWLLDSVYYDTGADLTVREEPLVLTSGMNGGMFPSVTSRTEEPTDAESSASITLADVGMIGDWYFSQEQHIENPAVEQATRVGRYKGTAYVGRERNPLWILGIDRLELPQVAFFRDDFATASLGELMNRLGAKPEGVLVPGYVADEQGLEVGDYLLISIVGGEQTYERDFEVIGVYDYFPTVYPDDRPTFIVNLEYIFGNPDAVDDYDIWLNLIEGTEIPPLVDEIGKETRMLVSVKGDAFGEIEAGQELVERVGLFGVLNVGFLTAGLMAAIGFVLYSYASLRRRFIELGILQAIGLSVRQLVGYLVTEQLLLMGLAISGGVVVGLMTSILFVPFLQTSASPGTPVPPFQVFIGWTEAAWLALGFGMVLCLTMLGTIAYLMRLKTFQAVKLGETL